MATLYKRARSSKWQARIKVGGRLERMSTGMPANRKTREAAQRYADQIEREKNVLAVGSAQEIGPADRSIRAEMIDRIGQLLAGRDLETVTLVGQIVDVALQLSERSRSDEPAIHQKGISFA